MPLVKHARLDLRVVLVLVLVLLVDLAPMKMALGQAVTTVDQDSSHKQVPSIALHVLWIHTIHHPELHLVYDALQAPLPMSLQVLVAWLVLLLKLVVPVVAVNQEKP